MNNMYRAVIFAGVVFFVLIIAVFWSVNNAQTTGKAVLDEQQKQKAISKQCANNCDQQIQAGELDCDWIECHEKCQIGQTCQKNS
ncbi:MAG: hypothetical protein ABH986_00685 [archaeon]